jgi:phosphoribosylformimino-5-aminoimidazole carboxamide ribotide isomerase
MIVPRVPQTRPPVPVDSFTIIPVLDLKHGKVVRARSGDRASYRPIVTPLSPTSEAVDVLRGLRRLAPFSTVYIADLDAIAGEGGHDSVLRGLRAAAPGVEFWVDAGYRRASDAHAVSSAGNTPVLGSETLVGTEQLATAMASFGAGRIVLSLDYRSGRFMGGHEIEQRVDLWPDRIILMTLDRVGTGTGPDLDALTALARRAGDRAIFAAGGVRHEDDLVQLQSIGVAGVLVATALHDRRLSAAAVSRLHR